MSQRRSSKKARGNRKEHAAGVQAALVSIVETTTKPTRLRQSATEKLIHLNRKHRLKMPKSVSIMICKKCSVLYDSSNSTTRIRYGQVIKICKMCNNVRRLGGGPKHHRK